MPLFYTCWNLLLRFSWTQDEIVCLHQRDLFCQNKQTNNPPPQQNKNQNQPCLLILRNDLHLGVHSEFVEVKNMYMGWKTGFILFYVELRPLPPALIFWVGWLGRELWRILNWARLWKMDTLWLSGIRIPWVVGKMRGGENTGQEYVIQNGLQCSPLQ